MLNPHDIANSVFHAKLESYLDEGLDRDDAEEMANFESGLAYDESLESDLIDLDFDV